MISALAVVCVRNEAVHIRRCLDDLIASGLEVWLIDNGSDDGTREAAQAYIGGGLLGIEDLPWNGSFSLTDQLRVKRRVVDEARHDWIIHCDADEWLVSPLDNQSLLDGIKDAHTSGCNYINFHEMVFVPKFEENFEQYDYSRKMSTYYFFQPSYPRLQRAWRRDAGFENSLSGGHLLVGEGLRRYPVDFILRHYIVLSQAQARRKYLGRIFSDEDQSKGWHKNRITITEENLIVRQDSRLRQLSDPASRTFDLTRPATRHFWEWSQYPMPVK